MEKQMERKAGEKMKVLEFERLYLMLSAMRIPPNLTIATKILYFMFVAGCYAVGGGLNLLIVFVVVTSSWQTIASDLSLSCVLMTELLALIKLSDCLKKREHHDSLIEELQSESHTTRTATEEAIRNKYVIFSRAIVWMQIILGNSTIMFINCSHVVDYEIDPKKDERPISDILFVSAFSAVLDITAHNVWYFWALQTFRSYLAGAWTIAYDGFYFGFTSEICAQFDILAHRLKHLSPDEEDDVLLPKVKGHLEHLDHIYSCADSLNDAFRIVMALQFCLTSFTISFTILQFTLLGFETGELLDICICLFYFLSIVTEFFFICYFSNLVTTQSEQMFGAIYEVDIQVLLRYKKYFTVMMQRTLRPIIMDGGPLINLTLESYLKVLKTSYSAFNMLSESK